MFTTISVNMFNCFTIPDTGVTAGARRGDFGSFFTDTGFWVAWAESAVDVRFK